jgi:hypothetical protein
LGIASGPRVPLYLFFKKDAATPANAAMAVNKVRVPAPASPLTLFTARATRANRNPIVLVSRALRYRSTRPPVLQQALVFSHYVRLLFVRFMSGFPVIEFFKKQS